MTNTEKIRIQARAARRPKLAFQSQLRPGQKATIAVKITDMLGEELLLTHEV